MAVMGDNEDITELLAAARDGNKAALDHLFQAVYGELRKIAHARRAEWQGNDTLSTTALVHESYLKLIGKGKADWNDRKHFYACASKAMRRILIDYAAMRRAAKRGGGARHVPLEDIPIASDEVAEELLAMDQALDQLESLSARQSQVVELRFFGGLNVKEIAQVMDVSVATVNRDWLMATAWLQVQMSA